MNYSEMSSEPWHLEEQRQAAWDRHMAQYPLCDKCGERILTRATRLVIFGACLAFCEDCIEAATIDAEDYYII